MSLTKQFFEKKVILTESERQVRELHKICDKDYNEENFNKSFFGLNSMNYNKTWVWYLDEYHSLSGSSGQGEPEYTIKRLNLPVIHYSNINAE